MSRKTEPNRDARGDDVETSLRVSAEDGGFRLQPRIANYEQFDVAVRLSLPLPDSVDHGQISPASPGADAWRLDADTLRLTESIDWANTVTRTCTVEGLDRSHLRDLADGATVEISDMDGIELAVETDLDVRLPSRRSVETESTQSAGDPEDAETEQSDGSKPDTADGRDECSDRDSSSPSLDPASADTTGPTADPTSEGTSDSEPRGRDSGANPSDAGLETGSEAVEEVERVDDTRPGPELHADDPPPPPDGGGTDDGTERSPPVDADYGEAVSGLPVPVERNPGASQFEWFEVDPARESTDTDPADDRGFLDRLRGYFPE